MSSTSSIVSVAGNRTTALLQNISELKSWNTILKNIRDAEISIISPDIQKLLEKVCHADISGSRESQLSILEALTHIRAEREELRYSEGVWILDDAIRKRLQALKSPLQTSSARAVSPPRKRARYASPLPPVLSRRSNSPSRRDSSPRWAPSPYRAFPRRDASPPRRRQNRSPPRQMTYQPALSQASPAVNDQPPQCIICYRYSVLDTHVNLDNCILWHRPSQGYYVLEVKGGERYEEYEDEYGVVHTLRPRSVQRVEHAKDYGFLMLDVACGFTDEVRNITMVFSDARYGREFVDYLSGLGGVVVERV